MNKQMLNMEELEQVNGGNIFGDAWDWVCDKAEEVYEKIKPHNPLDDLINNPIDNPIYWEAKR